MQDAPKPPVRTTDRQESCWRVTTNYCTILNGCSPNEIRTIGCDDGPECICPGALMRFQYDFGFTAKIAAILFVLVATNSCGDQDRLSLTVDARGRAISTIALIIAKDQGLYEKHGLNVTLLLRPPDNENGEGVS